MSTSRAPASAGGNVPSYAAMSIPLIAAARSHRFYRGTRSLEHSNRRRGVAGGTPCCPTAPAAPGPPLHLPLRFLEE